MSPSRSSYLAASRLYARWGRRPTPEWTGTIASPPRRASLRSGRPIDHATESFILSLLTPDPDRIGDVQWVRAERLLALHRLGPLAVATHRHLEGRYLPAPVANRLDPCYRAARSTALAHLEADEEIGRALGHSRLPFLRIGGAALLRAGVYADPGARPLHQLTFITRFETAARAVGTLMSLGYSPTREWCPGLIESRHSLLFRAREEAEGRTPVYVELIWRTEPLHLGRCAPPEVCPLWAGADSESGLPEPGPHLAFLAERLLLEVGERGYLLGLADIGRLLPRVESWERFLGVAQPRPYAPGVGFLLRALEEETGAPVPRGVIRSLGGSQVTLGPAARWIRPSHVIRRRGRSTHHPADVLRRGLLLGSPIRAVRAAAMALWPRESWLRARFSDADSPARSLRIRHLRSLLHTVPSAAGSTMNPRGSVVDRGNTRVGRAWRPGGAEPTVM